MIIFSLRVFLSFATIVSLKEIDRSKDFAVLYTKSAETQMSFQEAVQGVKIQCSYIFCFDDSNCKLNGTSRLLITLNSIEYAYSWEFNYKSFVDFFQKIQSPAVKEIDSDESYEILSSRKVSFIFTYSSDSELKAFTEVAEKLKPSHMYFGAAFNKTFEKKEQFVSSQLRLLGSDKIFGHVTTENYLEFINRNKCPVLLEYIEAEWLHECLQEKIVVTSVINKSRKHMWDLYGGKLKILGQELNDSSFQMMYVDSKKNSEYMKYYEIPFIPFFLIHDYRIDRTFYFGEYSFRNNRRMLKLFKDVKDKVLHPEDYTIDAINYTNYISIWQLIPLCFLVFGLAVIVFICIKQTFKKVKTS